MFSPSRSRRPILPRGLFSHRSAAARKSTILKRSEGSKLIQYAGGPLGLSRYRQHLRDSGCARSRQVRLLERNNAPSLNAFVEKHGTTASAVVRDDVEARPRHCQNRDILAAKQHHPIAYLYVGKAPIVVTTGHKNRSIKRLHLDLRNPRLGRPSVDTEADAMARLLKEFGTKIIGLARSIAEHGLNPTESWAIVREDGKYVVLEGNRRLVACGLLDNPRKAPDPETAAAFERIKRGGRATGSYLNPSCVEFERRADARYWIHLKHHGAGSGEGTAAWGPEMVYLDQVNSGSSRVEWNEFWYWLEETYQHDHTLVDLIGQARREQYTLMERVYTWKVKELLGASFTQPGQINVNVDPDKIKPFIHKLITGMLTPQPKDPKAPGAADILVISSRTLNSRDPAADKLADVWKDTIGDTDVTPTSQASTSATSTAQDAGGAEQVPSPSSASSSTAGTGAADNLASGAATGQKKSRAEGGSRTRQPKPRKSETHLYHGVQRSHMPDRLRNMLQECSQLEITTSPETASVMARVVVEAAADALIDHQNLQLKQRATLQDKLAVIMRHLDPLLDSKNPTQPGLAGTWAAVRTDTADGHFVRDLNSCVHFFQFTAAPEMAKRANTLFTPLLNAINTKLGNPPTGVVSTSNRNGQA